MPFLGICGYWVIIRPKDAFKGQKPFVRGIYLLNPLKCCEAAYLPLCACYAHICTSSALACIRADYAEAHREAYEMRMRSVRIMPAHQALERALLQSPSEKSYALLFFFVLACGKGFALTDAPPAGCKANALLAAQRAVCLLQRRSHHSMEDREQSSLW